MKLKQRKPVDSSGHRESWVGKEEMGEMVLNHSYGKLLLAFCVVKLPKALK
jgi:hypothetical protein